MSLRGRLVALAVVVSALFAVAIVALLGSATPGCTIATPRPALPAVLRALGDFDQSYDPTNSATLDDAATRAAAVLHPDLIGARAGAAVRVAAARSIDPTALVVPLIPPQPTGSGGARLEGLVVFLLDCQGNAYFSGVEDDAVALSPLSAFPPVSHDQAALALGSAAIRLDYTTAPLHPRWTTLMGLPRSIAAR